MAWVVGALLSAAGFVCLGFGILIATAPGAADSRLVQIYFAAFAIAFGLMFLGLGLMSLWRAYRGEE